MPALEANLERLPPETKGIALFEIVSPEDKHHITAPDGVEIRWVLNPHPDEPNDRLYRAVTTIPLPGLRTAIWIAGESGCIRKLRRYFKDVAGIDRPHFYGSGYWQIGLTEDAHQLTKRREVIET
jgi:NADPH-dependent ferric siderophore reductase